METGEFRRVVWDDNSSVAERQTDEHDSERHDEDDDDQVTYLVDDDLITSSVSNLHRIPQENLIYMTEDGTTGIGIDLMQEQVDQAEQIIVGNEEFMECEVTEEIITDDWVQQQGEECVEVSVEQLCSGVNIIDNDHDEVPLPTDQDEYTSSRPYPCDFCSRRFRKKANLMNHMIAHQNDRPHVCNLCGAKYIRRCDLLNHFKIHAYVPEDDDNSIIIPEVDEFTENNIDDDDDDFDNSNAIPKFKRRQHKNSTTSLDDAYELLMASPISCSILPNTITTSTISTPSLSNSSRKQNKTSGAGRSSAGRSTKSRARASVDGKSTKTSRDSSFYQSDDLNLAPSTTRPIESVKRYPVTDSRKPFVCQHCGVSFAREKALASHARIHGGDSPFECETCGEMFWDIMSLQDHISLRHSDQPASNSEYEPDENFENVANDDDDSADSDFDLLQNKMSQFYCVQCGMSFSRNDLLKRHVKSQHVKKESFDNYANQDDNDCRHCCNVCGEKFAEALDLLAHAEIHARFEHYKCLLCGETFGEESNIKNHIIAKHGHELTENSCRLCGKLCRDGRALMKHSWDHSREKNHSCSKCGKTFHNKARLKRHMQSHRNKSVQCEICHEKFPDGRSLMNHRHSHTKSSQFPCHECGKTFGSRSSQQIHLRIHTGERPYACRFCWKAFADGGTLRKHERIHTGEKPYVCSICPRAFNQRVVLREHIRSHHSAPDSKRGNTLAPYYCSVCSELFTSSALLIQHLIQHSDTNTALKRQPLSGPRKYKRRRKLKPHELERMGSPPTSQLYKEPASDESDNNKKRFKSEANNKSYNKSKNIESSSKSKQNSKANRLGNVDINDDEDNQNSDNEHDDIDDMLIENMIKQEGNMEFDKYSIPELSTSSLQFRRNAPILDNEDILPSTSSTSRSNRSAKSNASSSRPKMIHTQKTRIPISDGKRKTKTYITKEVKQEFAESIAVVKSERRARTKNVNNYISPLTEKVQPARFPLIGNDNSERDNETTIMTSRHHFDNPQLPDDDNLLLEISQKDKYYNKFNSDIVNDLEEILRSPIKTVNNSGSNLSSLLLSDDDSGVTIGTSSKSFPADISLQTTRRSTRTQKPTASQSKAQTATKANSSRTTDKQRVAAAGTARTTIISQHLLKKNLPKNKVVTRQTKTSGGRSTRSSNMLAINIKEEVTLDLDSNIGTSEDMNIKIEHDDNDDDDFSTEFGSSRRGSAPDMIANKLMSESDGVFKCEMCSLSFNDRSRLLLHVPSHILD